MNKYDKLSKERKELQAQGLIPEWYTTGGYQMFKEKYEHDTQGRSVRAQYERIAKTASEHLKGTKYESQAYDKFFELLWKGWLSASSPVLGNTGTNKGLPVSCGGSDIQDSIEGFYTNLLENSVLTKHGFGTSSNLSKIRPRGAKVSIGGKANGVIPVIKEHVQSMRNVSQGQNRRGAWAGYLDIEHGDFWELADLLKNEPDDLNLGWTIKDSFIAKLEANDAEAIARFKRVLFVKMLTGKGYFFFVDKANKKSPQVYKDLDLKINNSNLCSEIMLMNDAEHSFSCVLSSMNVSLWHQWKDTDAVFWATVFLDCIAEEFIQKAQSIPALEKTVRFTQKSRALGLGQAGLATLFQQDGLAFEGFEAHMLSNTIASHIHEESLKASKDMAQELGEPEWLVGYGLRNSHRIAIAPTKTSSLIMGGISEGINPDPSMTFTQTTSAGEIDRVNPTLLKVMKDKGVYTKKHIQEIVDAQGSVQGVSWLTDDEKLVFRTAFEMNMQSILRLASSRARFIDQWQSLNLFFSADEKPEVIAKVHKEAFLDENILGLYYIYTQAGVQASKESECLACQ